IKDVRQGQISAGIEVECGPGQPGRSVHSEGRNGAACDLTDIEIPDAANPAGRKDDSAVFVHQATRPSPQCGGEQERREKSLVASSQEAVFDTRCTPPVLSVSTL